MYSEFVPIGSEKSNEQSQLKLHKLMGQMIDELYDSPESLNLTVKEDEAYEWYTTNNTNPELDKIYRLIFQNLFDFYKFMYYSFLYGIAMENCLSIDSNILSKHKASYKSIYKSFLSKFGIDVKKSKAEIVFTADYDIIQSLRLLAERTPVNKDPWTPYDIINFACCSFTGDFSYLLSRVDKVTGLNGFLLGLQSKCLENGYEQNIKGSFRTTEFVFNITFRNRVGGFVIGYNPRKYWQFYFGSLTSIGIKAMLEDFNNLDNDLQKYFVNVCKTCDGCLACTKGGKNKVFAVKVKYDDKEYCLCNNNYGRHNWATIDHDLASVLFKYHAAQEIYGIDLKK